MNLHSRVAEKKAVALSSVVAALVITGLKLLVGIKTNSLGILSEAAHSGLDLMAALMTLFAVSYSDRPPDRLHQYGHGKVENMSALFETVLLFVTCGWILWEAVGRLMAGRAHVDVNIWGYLVIGLSIIVDFSRSRALSHMARKHHSQALEADALHFASDIWSSGVVLLGLVFVQLGYVWVDAIVAMLVAVLVLIVSYRLGRRAIDVLLDTSLPSAELDWLQEYLSGVKPPCIGFHGLRTRLSGATRFIELHLEIVPSTSLEDAHRCGDDVSAAIEQRFPGASVLVHLDPWDDEAGVEPVP